MEVYAEKCWSPDLSAPPARNGLVPQIVVHRNSAPDLGGVRVCRRAKEAVKMFPLTAPTDISRGLIAVRRRGSRRRRSRFPVWFTRIPSGRPVSRFDPISGYFRDLKH